MAEGSREVPLHEFYASCKAQYDDCMQGALPEDEYMMLIESFRKLLKDIKKANLWSKNETLEEVATSALKYFLVPHYFVQLLLHCPFGHRPTVIEEALVWHGLFLDRCLAMEAMSSNDRRLYDREEGENHFSPEELRTMKVERLKRNKELNEKLQLIEERRKKMNLTDENSFQYENLERRLYLIQLDQAIGQDVRQMRTINLELQLAEMHEKQKSVPKRERKRYRARARPPASTGVTFIGPDGRTRKFKNLSEYRANAKEIQEAIDNPDIRQASASRSSGDRVITSAPVVQTYQGPVKREKPKPAAVPKNILPGVVNMDPIGSQVDQIVNKRENTFKEYVERWKYTVEEGFEFDVMNGKVQLDSHNHESPPKKEDDEMTEEEFDVEQQKRRAWDNWKEDNKKGSGNPYYDPRR